MEVFIKKIGGKYCPSFKFGNQTFHLKGYDEREEAEQMAKQLKVCFSNYGLLIINKHNERLLKESVGKIKELLNEVE